ncbi:MAG: oligosaccharide flippase family protein [Lachnospiraceae bacterium]|nr:oligosaccharide flippase family protein [Lachnospiraceae bacterium]
MISKIKNNKLWRLWCDLPLAVRTMIAIAAASFFQSGMKLIFVPVFTRILTTSEYGVTTLFESLQTTLGTITMLSLSTSVYNRGMQEFKKDRDTFTSSLLVLSNLCTLVTALFIFIFWDSLKDLIGLKWQYMVIMFANFLFLPAYNFWVARQKFEYRYRGMLAVTVFINLFSPIVGIIMVLGNSDDPAFAKIIGSEIVLLIAYIPIYFYIMRGSRGKVKRKYISYGLKFNLPLVPHYASQQILSSCDRIMIAYLIDSASAGIYGLSYQVSTVIRVLWSAINAVLVPWEYDKIEAEKTEDIRKMTRFLIILYALFCVALMFVAPEMIRIFAPSSYHEGIYIMAPVTAGVFFSGLYSLFAILEFYYKKNIYVMIASCISAISNIILNWIFIPIYGYQAAAYTTLACYALYAMLHAFNLKRLKIDYFYDMKAIGLLSVAVILISLIVVHTYDGYGCMIRYGLLCCLAVLFIRKRQVLLTALQSMRK